MQNSSSIPHISNLQMLGVELNKYNLTFQVEVKFVCLYLFLKCA